MVQQTKHKRPNPAPAPIEPAMPTIQPSSTPAEAAQSQLPQDQARYVSGSDWIADGTQLPAGTAFAQSWQIRNVGETTWGVGYKLLWVGDETIGAPPQVEVPACPPGEQIRITVPYVAPREAGLYKSTWQLCNHRGERFGDRLWVLIEVAATAAGSAHRFPPPPQQMITLTSGVDALTQTVVETWNGYGGLLLEESQKFGLDPSIATAVLIAEANGRAFGSDGRMIIRFENHIFYDEWGKQHEAQYQQHFGFDPRERWRNHQWRRDPQRAWERCHVDQSSEWAVFTFARTLDETAAMRSISMAAPQIMGFNHAAVGYPTVQQMFHAFQSDIRQQLQGFFRFVDSRGLIAPLQRGDFYTFAKGYNGAGQAQVYQQLIQQNIQIYQRAMQFTTGSQTRTASPTPLSPSPSPTTWSSDLLPVETDEELGRYAAWRKRTACRTSQRQNRLPQLIESMLYPYHFLTWLCSAFWALSLATVVLACLAHKEVNQQ
ncbi:MAG: DUF3380 domain-containing protein [Caldilineaceae bacterium]|nr:DUF3380 domain-containing protein [Caldilineaceae bacterium]